MFRLDFRPFKGMVKMQVEVLVDDDFDVRGSLDEFLWFTVKQARWSVGPASEVEVITDRLAALPPDAESFEITDREHDLVMEAHRAAQGPDRLTMPFLRRLEKAEQISVDERGAIIA